MCKAFHLYCAYHLLTFFCLLLSILTHRTLVYLVSPSPAPNLTQSCLFRAFDLFMCAYTQIRLDVRYMLNILHESTQTIRIGEIKQENVTTFSAQLNRIMTGETINKAPIKSGYIIAFRYIYMCAHSCVYVILSSHKRWLAA